MEFTYFIILSIFISACAGTVGSFLWYAIFLKKDSFTINEEAIEIESLKSLKNVFRLSFLAHLFSATAMFMLVYFFQIKSFFQGVNIIFSIWFLLAIISGVKKIIIDKKSWENFILGAGHDCINILIIFSVLILLIKF